MSFTYRIAQLADAELIYQFAENKLAEKVSDEMERMMQIWESRFRKEALEHYLKLGWSFIGFDEDQNCVGFFIGQPLLFFEGHTQALWVEFIQAHDFKIEAELAEIAIKLSKDKHFQRVILPKKTETLHFEKTYIFNTFSETAVWVKTTK